MENYDLVVLKLISGESVVSDTHYNEKDGIITLRNPFIIDFDVDENGRPKINVARWVEADQQTFDIQPWHILASAEPDTYTRNIYNTAVKRCEEVLDKIKILEQSEDLLNEYIEKSLERGQLPTKGSTQIH